VAFEPNFVQQETSGNDMLECHIRENGFQNADSTETDDQDKNNGLVNGHVMLQRASGPPPPPDVVNDDSDPTPQLQVS